MHYLQKLWKYAITAIYVPVKAIYSLILHLLPIDKNQVLFSSFPDYSDNSKVLYHYMISDSKYNELHFVWLVKNINSKMINTERTVFLEGGSSWHFGMSLAVLRAIATSRYIFYTHSSPVFHIKEKKGQTVINLWHGCGYKDRGNPLPKKKQFDFGLVPGKAFIDVKSKFWGCQKEQVIPIGYPRYDQMKNVSDETKIYYRNLKKEFDKVILWMPTFRKTERNEFAASKMTGYFELPLVDSVEQLSEINEYCKKMNTLLCIKRHPKQIRYKCEDISFSNIVFICNQDLDEQNADLYGLFALVDGLISDYSSSAIDFLLMDKPIAFSLNDMDDYGKTQGFVFKDPLRYMPGHHLYSMPDMEKFIEDVCNDLDPYKNDRDAVIVETHNPCVNYCERICNFVIK